MEPLHYNRAFFGSQLAGLLLNIMLFGVFLAQVHSYWRQYNRKDRLFLKAMVLYLLVAETANSILTSAIVFDPLVIQMGCSEACSEAVRHGEVLPSIRPSKFLTGNASGIVAISAPVQLFYAWRIYTTTRSKAAAGWIILFTLLSTAAALVAAVLRPILPHQTFDLLRYPLIIWLSAAVVADVSISVFLIRFLRSHKGGFATSDNLIDKIVMATVQTGALPSLFAILDMIFFVIGPVNRIGISFIFDFPLSKLYSNFFLSTLNARAAWNALLKSQENAPVPSFIQLSPLGARRPRSNDSSKPASQFSEHRLENIRFNVPLSQADP